MGISIQITSLTLPDLEINLYGTSGDICVVGEATVRARVGLIDELLDKLEKIKTRYPERLREKIILVIYASLPMTDSALRYAIMEGLRGCPHRCSFCSQFNGFIGVEDGGLNRLKESLMKCNSYMRITT